MANLITVSALRYGEREFGTTLADAQIMVLSSEHIIYGTNVETLMSVTLTGGVGSSDTFTFSGQTGLTNGEYVRVGNVGDGVATMDVLSSDLVPGTIFKVKDINSGTNPKMQTDEAGTTATVQNTESGLALESYIVQGELVYADPAQGGAPIKIRTVEPCAGVADGFGMSIKSGQLRTINLNKKNGISHRLSADIVLATQNLMINLDRVVMAYEGDLSTTSVVADDWVAFYDISNTNFAGVDSPFVDILEIETSLDGFMTSFTQHAGNKGALLDFASLTVNGNAVAFPDTTRSGLVRVKNVCSGFENSSSKLELLVKHSGKAGFDTLALDETYADVLTVPTATPAYAKSEHALAS